MPGLTPLNCPLPEGWRLALLGEMCSKIGSGATPKGGVAAYIGSGVAFIRSQNVLDHAFTRKGLAFIDDEAAGRLSGVTVQPRDVLLNITGDGDTIARCCVVPNDIIPARVSQHVVILRSSREIIPEYLQRYLSHPAIRAYMLSHNSGGSRRALTKAQIEKFQIVVPPRAVQSAIADILGVIDDKIAINNSISEKGRELVFSLASDKLWGETVPLSEIVTSEGRQVSPEMVEADVVAHYSLPAFDDGEVPEIVTPASIKSGKFYVDGAAVLLSKLNPSTPRVWSVEPDPKIPALTSTEFLVLKPRPGIATDVVWAICSQPKFIGELASMATGTSNSHQRVRPINLLATRVVDPRIIGDNERAAIAAVGERVRAARSESLTLARLRNVLLPKLMSGEIRVRDAEKVVEDVT